MSGDVRGRALVGTAVLFGIGCCWHWFVMDVLLYLISFFTWFDFMQDFSVYVASTGSLDLASSGFAVIISIIPIMFLSAILLFCACAVLIAGIFVFYRIRIFNDWLQELNF